jgi:hypothetical protein
MNERKFRNYWCQKDGARYEIDEDLVGWYLIYYKDQNSKKSSEDYLCNSLEEAFTKAQRRYDVPREAWQKTVIHN